MKQKVIYYEDELNDEFSEIKITPRKIDENYKYIHKNPFWIFFAFLFNVSIFPIKKLYPKLKFNIKYIGKEKLKLYKNKGYFIYVNHTQELADTCIPSNVVWPKRNYIIVNPENVSMPFIKNGVQMLGAIPIPGNIQASKNFFEKIKKVIKKGGSITIYPEAHIWPYYTKIRNFKSVSFKYPIDLDVPTFCMTNTYIKNEKNKKINIVTYIDGPFFPDKKLNKQEQKQDLRNKVYKQMSERSKYSNIEHIKYIFKKSGVFENAKNVNDS